MKPEYSAIGNAFSGTVFTWAATAFGAASVLLIPRDVHPKSEKRFLDLCLGFAGGVMLAATFWSLLEPAFEFAREQGWKTSTSDLSWVPVALGFFCGAAFVLITDLLLPDNADDIAGFLTDSSSEPVEGAKSALDKGHPLATPNPGSALSTSKASSRRSRRLREEDENLEVKPSRKGASRSRSRGRALQHEDAAFAESTHQAQSSSPSPLDVHTARSWRRVLLLIIAITVHNFPEGLAVGVGFGALNELQPGSDKYLELFKQAKSLAIGIGLQNIPEGMAVALPLLRLGVSPFKAFLLGQLSGVFEIFAGLLGAFAMMTVRAILPFTMAFAGGAMVFVVVEQLVPEAHQEEDKRILETKSKSQSWLCARVGQVHPGTLASCGLICGFIVMMVMDVAL